jgi:hypothetical protein
MELTELQYLSQDQLLELINKATALLEYGLYKETHLFKNGQHAEPVLWFDASK